MLSVLHRNVTMYIRTSTHMTRVYFRGYVISYAAGYWTILPPHTEVERPWAQISLTAFGEHPCNSNPIKCRVYDCIKRLSHVHRHLWRRKRLFPATHAGGNKNRVIYRQNKRCLISFESCVASMVQYVTRVACIEERVSQWLWPILRSYFGTCQ